MKYSKFVMFVLVLSLMVITLSSTGLAFPGYGPGGMMNYHMGPGYYNNVQEDYNPLDLTEEQQDLLRDRREELADKYIELHDQLRELNLELRGLLISNGGEDDISILKDQISTLQSEIIDVRTDYWKGLKEVLTDQQLEELDDLFKDIENGSGRLGMRMYGFRGGRMQAGRGFYPGGRTPFAQNNFICPFGF